MQRKFIVCDASKCVGCQICEIACSSAKEGYFNPTLSRIHVAHLKTTDEPIRSMAIACHLCDEPACVRSCPRLALTADEKTGTITINDKYSGCNACGWCMVACEFGAPVLNMETMTAKICDLCPEESEPPCVKACPKEALSLATIEEVTQKTESETSKKLLKELAYARENSKTFYERFGFIPIQPKQQK